MMLRKGGEGGGEAGKEGGFSRYRYSWPRKKLLRRPPPVDSSGQNIKRKWK